MQRQPQPDHSPQRRLHGDDRTLVEQTFAWMRQRIDERVVRPGTRVPSIRSLAVERQVSRFTIVEAYDRLVAHGYLESRRGSGFYVRETGRAAAASNGLRAPEGRRVTTDAAGIDAQ